MSDEKRYTYAEAKVIGKRALCEAEGEMHDFHRFSIWDFKGEPTVDRYTCLKCDAIITITYPELGC